MKIKLYLFLYGVENWIDTVSCVDLLPMFREHFSLLLQTVEQVQVAPPFKTVN